ncbi:hypothetical protein ACQP2U_23435 [Nocardia sp. CA-084685]|uniref:hypothetical protein n=1 Tax=Nocardia sp. CA-084685 TaxID=3239970 RepID=UPI003D98E9CC
MEGLAIAWSLADRGATDVLVVERDILCSGTTVNPAEWCAATTARRHWPPWSGTATMSSAARAKPSRQGSSSSNALCCEESARLNNGRLEFGPDHQCPPPGPRTLSTKHSLAASRCGVWVDYR